MAGRLGLHEFNTGSDAGRMKTVAEPDGDYYILNGTKKFHHPMESRARCLWWLPRTGELLDMRHDAMDY